MISVTMPVKVKAINREGRRSLVCCVRRQESVQGIAYIII
jgi:hypothetical protein